LPGWRQWPLFSSDTACAGAGRGAHGSIPLDSLDSLDRCPARFFHAPDLFRLPDFWQRRERDFSLFRTESCDSPRRSGNDQAIFAWSRTRFTAAHSLSAVIGSLPATDKQHDAVELLFRRHCLNKGVCAKMDAFRAVCKGL
jgi:hypothetical protein